MPEITLKTQWGFPPLNINKVRCLEYETKTKLKYPYTFINNKCLLGIEIEVENIQNSVYHFNPYWTAEEDNSLRNYGVEFKSLPLRAFQIPYAIELLKQRLYLENDPSFSNRTSIHIHLNVRDFTLSRLKTFLLLYCIFEKHFFNIAGTRRESNIFCVPLYKTEVPIHLNNPDHQLKTWNKYSALNLGCVLGSADNKKFGTIEFRHLYGTLDTNIIYPWIDSIIHLREASYKIPLENLIETIKSLNTTSEYISLYKQVFKKTCLNLNLISKKDFESCITHTKLNLFSPNNSLNSKKNYLEKNFNFLNLMYPDVSST